MPPHHLRRAAHYLRAAGLDILAAESLRYAREFDEAAHLRDAGGRFATLPGGQSLGGPASKRGVLSSALSSVAGLPKKAKRLARKLWVGYARNRHDPVARKKIKQVAGWAIAAEHVAMKGFSKGKKAVASLAKERGLSEEQADRAAKVVAVIDQALAWTTTFPAVTAATGNPALGKAASFLPMGSMCYVAWSTARNPLATWRAARKAWTAWGESSREKARQQAGERSQQAPGGRPTARGLELMGLADRHAREWTEEDERKHPRDEDGKFGRKDASTGPATKFKERPEWDGVIDEDEVEESRRRGDWIVSFNTYDEHNQPWETDVYRQEGTYDPFPDDPDSEPIDVYRWVASSDGAGILAEGEWTNDPDVAANGAQEYAWANEEEAPADEEEEDEDGDRLGRMAEATGLFDSFDDYDAVNLLGIPDSGDDTTVTWGKVERWEGHYSDDVPLDAYGFEVTIGHPKLKDCRRFIGIDAEGRKFIKNDLIEIKKEYQGEGLGTTIFSAQVAQAAEQGFDYIQCHAAGEPGGRMNGYYSWPRMGYDESVESIRKHNHSLAGKIEEAFPDAESVLDIFESPGGEEWWKANGSDLYDARFDLSEGSRSREVLAAYLAERAKRKG